ncbi:MAG: hypothetical protein HON29_00070 [Candidatus Magasanikbacteria bacterium]|nr:hypothetical protein [Candidatus Magasanikbacteria bacterium]
MKSNSFILLLLVSLLAFLSLSIDCDTEGFGVQNEILAYKSINPVPSIFSTSQLVTMRTHKDTTLNGLLDVVRESVVLLQNKHESVCNIFIIDKSARPCHREKEIRDIFLYLEPILYDRAFMKRALVHSHGFFTAPIRADMKKLHIVLTHQEEWLHEMLMYYLAENNNDQERLFVYSELLTKKYHLPIRVLSFVYRRITRDRAWLKDMLTLFSQTQEQGEML